MKITTTRFDDFDISEEEIIYMPTGMLGFPKKNRFVIIQQKEMFPFCWYQSVDDPALAFVVISPFIFMPDYSIDTESTLSELSWHETKENLDLYVVVNASGGSLAKMTANLIGPVLINTRIREAVQIVIHNSPYSCRHILFSKEGHVRSTS